MPRRKLTDAEKEARKHQRSADKRNAKTEEELGMFAALEPQADARSEYWRWRFNVAKHFGQPHTNADKGVLGLCWLELHAIERWARKTLGPVADKIAAHIRRVYPCPDYSAGIWAEVVAGKRLVFAVARVENRQPGQPAVVDTDWYEHLTMTREAFWQLFPYDRFKEKLDPAPFDSEPFDLRQWVPHIYEPNQPKE